MKLSNRAELRDKTGALASALLTARDEKAATQFALEFRQLCTKADIQTLISAPQKRTNVTPIGSQPSDGSDPAGRAGQDETGNSYVIVSSI